jgi:hypothetical protein
MGLFTYRQTKQTKKQVAQLRTDQARQAQAQQVQQATLAAQSRETQLFQALPPEGKEEFRAVKAAFDEQAKTWSSWKHGWGGKEVREAQKRFREGKQAVFRKYDLVP